MIPREVLQPPLEVGEPAQGERTTRDPPEEVSGTQEVASQFAASQGGLKQDWPFLDSKVTPSEQGFPTFGI